MDDDKTAAAAAAERTTTMRHVPQELIREILIRLPVRSLLRFTRVCKAWRDTISDDPSFGRAQLRHNRHKQDDPCVLIAPQMGAYRRHDNGIVPTAGLYRWRESRGGAALVYPMDSLRWESARPLAHCDGLVLVATASAVRIVNPAMRGVVKLPEIFREDGAAFGLGCDPCTGAYKVARLFDTTEIGPSGITGNNAEVFTIGADKHWREPKARPPQGIMPQQTATFFKGSLLWITLNRYNQNITAYLRFSLEDESFSTVPSPPYRRPSTNHKASTLSELRGELCVASRHNRRAIDIWMCADLDGAGANPPRWEKRYTVRRDRPWSSLHPVAVLGDGALVCEASPGNRLCRCDLRTEKRAWVKHSF